MSYRQHHTRGKFRAGATAAAVVVAAAAAVARGQTFESTGTDFSPVNVGGKVVTNAHDDSTGTDYTNVRVSAYAFRVDPEDPNFTQDPGFNTPAGGLPAGATLSFSVLDSLKYFGGAGPLTFTAPPSNESLQYSFGPISSVVLTGSSGPLPGFNLGAVTSAGAFHKHLSAFLRDSSGSFDPSAMPTPGVYVAQLQVNVTGLASSAPIFAVYSNGASATAVDRTKFYLRNNLAPGSTLFGLTTSLVGLSAVPGDANLAAGGTVAVTGSARASAVNTLTSAANAGSVAISGLGAAETTYAVLWMNGTSSDVSAAVAHMDIPGDYDVAPANASPSDPLYAEIQKLSATYSGFSAVVEFDAPANNTAFNWAFAADPSVTLGKIAIAGTSVGSSPPTWKDVNGSWGSAANWSGGVVPDGTSAVAIFGASSAAYTSAHVVTLDGNRAVGTVTFNSSLSVTIAPGTGGTLTMDNGASAALISASAGSHTIAVPVSSTASGLTVSATNGAALTIAAPITGAGVTVTGSGMVTLAAPAGTNAHAGVISVSSLALASGAHLTVAYADRAQGLLSRVVVAGSLAGSGVLDLTDNDMLLHDASEQAIDALISSGHIVSSAAGTGTGMDRLAMLAVVTNSDGAGGPLFSTFDGVAAAPTDVLVRYTYGGDTDLNGVVDASDLANLLAGESGHLTGWANGDFNRDGTIDGADLAILMASLQGQGASFGSPSEGGGPGGAVPEPASLAWLALALPPLARRGKTR